MLAVVANIRFTGMVLDTRKIYTDVVIAEKRKAIIANSEIDVIRLFTRNNESFSFSLTHPWRFIRGSIPRMGAKEMRGALIDLQNVNYLILTVMSKVTSGNGVKVAEQIIKTNSIWGITDARRAATATICKEAGMKKEELAQLVWKLKTVENEKEAKKRDKLLIKGDMKALGCKTQKEYKALKERENELKKHIVSFFPYRQAEGKWCEPTNVIRVTITQEALSASGGSRKSYSTNGKWGGVESVYYFQIPKTHTAMVVGGMVTAFAIDDEHKYIKQCTWWEQSKGFELKKYTGWLVGGYHSTAKTRETAVRGMKQSQSYYFAKDEQVLNPEYAHRKWGFCMSGIRNFMATNGIENDNITMKELRAVVIQNRELNCKAYRSHLAKMGIILNCQ